MKSEELKRILTDLYQQKTTPAESLEILKTLPFENLDFAHIDHHRHLRTGQPEAIFCEGKSQKQLVTIIKKMGKAKSDILATKLAPDIFKSIKKHLPKNAEYNESSRTLVIRKKKKAKGKGLVVIVTAGTSDIPVAEEAAVTAELFGSRVETVFDVGVAGIHRLLHNMERFREARVVVAVAGMDGALASVVGGLIENPVIAVPTSVGYGASFNGVAALLTMLNSCAQGVATVNIDNGFGAGSMAHKINMLGEPPASEGA
ncbi:MAG: 1-(5-phosphoribosyl)-5-amino-4-imidazole-carboxyl ate carboxylase [Nitrospinaceae bacterium]|nr:MAG: 1-(5-phosphoribosyl)-5-amino-4-imidazole-carboxyl ate carboxylase [Nitrospinaceae bacterium]